MNKTRLKPEIIEYLSEKTGLKKATIRKDISILKVDYPKSIRNAVAKINTRKKGLTLMQKLSEEDKKKSTRSHDN